MQDYVKKRYSFEPPIISIFGSPLMNPGMSSTKETLLHLLLDHLLP